MSVEPWIEAWPRIAMIPPPGRPMLPSSSCTIAAGARIICTPDGVLRPADRVDEHRGALAAGVLDQRLGDLEEVVLRIPQIFSTISGV